MTASAPSRTAFATSEAFERQLDAEVPAGDHDPVEGLDHGLEVVDGLGLLQLGDHRRTAPHPVHHLVHEPDVGRRPHEGQGDEVHAEAEGELEVRDVLLRQGGHRHVEDLQPDAAVVDEQAVARLRVGRQRGVGRRDTMRGAGHVVHGDADGVAGVPLHRTVREPAEPDLRPLQVREDADGAALGVGRVAHHLVHALVVVARAVAEVEPGDVHAGSDQLPDTVGRGGGRPDGADDLGATGHGVQPSALSVTIR